MSLSSIEEEARNIIRSAELKAEEILAKARREAEELLKKEVVVELPQEVVRALESEFLKRLSEVRERHELRVRELRSRYEVIKDELVREYLHMVLGL